LVFHSSTITMMHGPINIRLEYMNEATLIYPSRGTSLFLPVETLFTSLKSLSSLLLLRLDSVTM